MAYAAPLNVGQPPKWFPKDHSSLGAGAELGMFISSGAMAKVGISLHTSLPKDQAWQHGPSRIMFLDTYGLRSISRRTQRCLGLCMETALTPMLKLVVIWLGVPVAMTSAMVLWPQLSVERRADRPCLWAISVLEHAIIAGQALTVFGLLYHVLPVTGLAWLEGALYALYIVFLSLDVALFLVCRMRMQWQLLKLTEALTGFADGLPWRHAFAGTGVAMLVALWCGHEASRSAVVGKGAPALVAVSALWMPLLVVRWGLGRYLPPRLAVQWNNRLFAMETAFLGAMLNHLLNRHGRGRLNALSRMRGNDDALEAGHGYPLWRRSNHHRWPKRTKVQLGPREKPHVVMLFLESFRGLDVGALGGAHGVTPHFDRLSRDGVLWRNFFANGNTTSRAMVSTFYGVLPPFGEISTQAAVNPPPLVGMPHMFSRLGYHSAFFCDGPKDWENKRNFFLKHGFDAFFAADSIRMAYPQAPRAGIWRFEDEYLMRFHADWLARHRDLGVPTFSSVLTVTNHTPFFARANFPKPQVDLDPQSDHYRFLRTMMYTDQCLGLYVDLLRARGLDKNVILCVLGDHGQTFDPKTHALNFSGAYQDRHLRVPTLLLAPGRVSPEVIDEVASQTDLLPTVMDLFNIDAPHHAAGISMLRKCDARRAVTQHQFSPAFSSVREGDLRYTRLFETNQSELYNLRTDPLETRNLAGQVPHQTAKLAAEIDALREVVEHLHKTKAFAPPDASEKPQIEATYLPADYPATATAAHTRHKALSKSVTMGTATSLDKLEKQMLDHVWAEMSLGASWLQICQMIFRHTHRQTMGEMHKSQDAALSELEGRLSG